MSKLPQLKFTDPAPDVELLTSSGETIRLSSLWAKSTLLLAFTRHFGCPQCKDLLDRLSEYRPELEKAGITIAVVTQGAPADTAAFCAEYAPHLTCLADPQRKAYTAFGLGRGGLSQTVFSLRVHRANQRVQARKGWTPQMPPAGQDAMLMSGIFIIGLDGRLRLPYYYDDISDHPTLDLLVHGIMGVDWNRSFEGPIVTQHTDSDTKQAADSSRGNPNNEDLSK
jgi:peroxiredoxin